MTDTVSVEKESLGQRTVKNAAVPSLIPSASIVLPEIPMTPPIGYGSYIPEAQFMDEPD